MFTILNALSYVRAFSKMLLGIALFALVVQSLAVPVTVTTSWDGGYVGQFSLPVTKTLNGWKAKLTFSSPVTTLEIWDADISQTLNGGREFILVNKDYNSNLKAGDSLSMTFVIRVTGPNPASASVDFITDDGGSQAPVDPQVPQDGQGPQDVPQFPSSSGVYNYNEVLGKSILFYEAQRSGRLPANNRIPWRGDSALQDKGANGEDLTGGWYDAGDHVKFGFPMAFTVTLLSWGLVDYSNAYKASGQYNAMLESIKWPLDYFIKAHVSKYEFYGQVGDGFADHAFWGRPEDMTMARPAYKISSTQPGSELAAETAAAMAAGYLAFKDVDSAYARNLLQHAKDLYELAERFQGTYANSIPDIGNFYNSWSGYRDELAWGAAWLYRATGDAQYLTLTNMYYESKVAQTFSWDDKLAGYQVLMHQITKQAKYASDVQTYLNKYMPGGGVSYTPKGLAYPDVWGPLRYTANTAFLALIAADGGLNPTAYRNFAKSQIHYMLGDTGRSYVVGFGNNPPNAPHHRSSSCPSRPAPCSWNDYNNRGPNPQILNGALVGGPDQSDNYVNDRSDYRLNEVATDYNAGFQSAVAGLKNLEITSRY